MQVDKQIESFLQQYFRGNLSPEEKKRLEELIKSNPSLGETINSVLSGITSEEAERLLADKSMMSVMSSISEEDEALIELYFSGLLEPSEEEDFKKRIKSDGNLRSNTLAQAFLIKAIEKIRQDDSKIIDSAKNISELDIRSFIDDLRDEENDALIQSYLSGELSESETKDFKNKLQSDDRMKERAAATVMLAKGVQRVQNQSQKELADAKTASKEDIKGVIANSKHISAFKNTRNIIVRVAAVAIVAVFIGGLWDYNNYSQMMSTTNQTMDGVITELNNTEGVSRGPQDDTASKLEKTFAAVRSDGNVKESIKELEHYYNIANDEYADSEDEYIDQISLALASAYIYDGQTSKAEELLNRILKDERASDETKSRAKELKKAVEKPVLFKFFK